MVWKHGLVLWLDGGEKEFKMQLLVVCGAMVSRWVAVGLHNFPGFHQVTGDLAGVSGLLPHPSCEVWNSLSLGFTSTLSQPISGT